MAKDKKENISKNNNSTESVKDKIRDWVTSLVYSLAIVMVIRILLIEAYTIPTSSMEKSLLVGDFLFVNKLIYGPKIPFTDIRLPGVREVNRGDVIVFIYPRDNSMNYVKRCVGMPGDVFEVRDKVVHVNGMPYPLVSTGIYLDRDTLKKEYVEDRIFPRGSSFNRDQFGKIIIPKKGDVVNLNIQTFYLYKYILEYEGHKVALMGSDVFVDGVKTTQYTIGQNYYFGMGDNRDNSEDSRYWGFVPENNILGSPLIIYWSWNPEISIFRLFDKIASIRWRRIAKPLW